MTVADLIALLADMPADATVIVPDRDWGYSHPTVVLDDDGEVVIAPVVC